LGITRKNIGPAEGLVIIPRKEPVNEWTPQLKADASLTEEQMEAGVGILLGDGSMDPCKDGPAFILTQSTAHTLYLFAVFGLFFDLCTNLPQLYCKWDVRYMCYYYSWGFRTASLPCFDVLYSLFYDEQGNRRIHPTIFEYFTPISLAHWIMCYGEKIARGGLFLATYSFTLEEVDLLLSVLQNKFGLDCHRIIKRDRGKVYWRIYISGKKANLTKLTNLVLPHMHASFHYKLGI